MSSYGFGPSAVFAKPTPLHALTPGAEAARESLRRLGHEKRLRREVESIVTDHSRPHVDVYDGPAPTAAKRLAATAYSHGFEIIERRTPEGHVVEGHHVAQRVGFRAYWKRGEAGGGTWHEPSERWAIVDISDRPIGVDKIAHTTKVGCRHDESDRTRTVRVASPRGVSLNVTEIEKRIRA